MHILFLTWKDIKHPHAGGAEKVMYEYASGLIKLWHTVTWFASSFSGAKSEEMIDDIQIIRKYANHTIWMFAWIWYREFKKAHQIDIIIDEAGGWPLLSPLYEKRIPIYFFAHHIGDREFDAFPTPVGQLARLTYKTLFRVYKKTPTIAVSNSTREELIADFWYISENISVIENTTDINPIDTIDFDSKTHDIVFLGRLTTIKRPDHAIRAFSLALENIPEDSRLHIIGNAQDLKYVESLKKLVSELHIADRVIFHGYLSTEEYTHILVTSRCLLVPSEKEWYGLVVIEANAYGLPVIGYDVAGLRDSIHSGKNGILVPDGDMMVLSRQLIDIFANEDAYRILSETSLKYAKNIPKWSEQVAKLEKIITQK